MTDPTADPAGDRIGAIFWIALGTAIAVGAWRMDRLDRMQIKPWEVPGLVPGLLGTALALLGLVLLFRSRPAPPANAAPAPTVEARRVTIALTIGLVYALGLVGSGLPFWLASTIFVSAFVFLLDRKRQQALGRSARSIAVGAIAFGLTVGVVVHVVFEQVFLVRLP